MMNKWILTLAIAGIFGSAGANAGSLESREGVKIEKEKAKVKRIKKHREKKHINRAVRKTKRSGNKF
jgi:hypothetical protein